MKKGKWTAVVMAVVLLMGFGMSALASDYTYRTVNNIYGSVSTGTRMGSASTRNNQSGGQTSYVSVKVRYTTSAGGTYWSAASTKSSNTTSASVSRSENGAVVGAESAHGTSRNNIEFILQVGK